MKIILASHNEHKVAEIRKLLPQSIELVSLCDIGYHDEIPETGATLEENSKIKAKVIFEKTKLPTIADDTGLEVLSLLNSPGVRSARYAGEPKSDKKNIEKLLFELQNKVNRSARFRTVFTLISENVFQQFEGGVDGQISKAPIGAGGFGYDSVFYPEDNKFTFAQMTMEEKNNMSHRARALAKMILFLNQNHEKL
jgi:XTP/dITP diphosphohydrolase